MRSQIPMVIDQLSERLHQYDDTLYVKDIARIFNKHPETIRSYIGDGKLKAYLQGRKFVIAKAWVHEFLSTYGEIILDSGYNFNLKQQIRFDAVVLFCREPRSYQELLVFTKIKNKPHLQKTITRPLLKSGRLSLLYPETPHSNMQKYVSTRKP